MNMYEVFNFMK